MEPSSDDMNSAENGSPGRIPGCKGNTCAVAVAPAPVVKIVTKEIGLAPVRVPGVAALFLLAKEQPAPTGRPVQLRVNTTVDVDGTP
jgi:hypothetical protein